MPSRVNLQVLENRRNLGLLRSQEQQPGLTGLHFLLKAGHREAPVMAIVLGLVGRKHLNHLLMYC